MNLTKKQRLEKTAAGMRSQPKTGGNAWRNRTRSGEERAATEAEARRQCPYAVIYTLRGRSAIFGYSANPDSGGVLKIARLVPWAKDPHVRHETP